MSAMVQKIGILLFVSGLLVFTLLPVFDSYQLLPDSLGVGHEFHRREILAQAKAAGLKGKQYNNSFSFAIDLKKAIQRAQHSLAAQPLPEGINEWDFKISNWEVNEYTFQTALKSGNGLVSKKPWLFFLLTIGLGILGGLLFILPKFRELPGIKNNHIFHHPATRGLKAGLRNFFLGAVLSGTIAYGFFYTGGDLLWPLLTAGVSLLIIGLVLFFEKQKQHIGNRSASPVQTGWLGVWWGVYLIGFYILLYWLPQFTAPWVAMVNPLSKALSGQPASQWFLYGLLYTVVVLVMGVRMIARYRHNRYQLLRTGSVMFFQTAFAFLVPEILVRLNQPYYDFKNIWPLDYSFFFDYNLNKLISSGGLGIFMLGWGIALIVVAVPLLTYFFGKRWYCSWVCGCGALAETLGDPWRQLSDKSLKAWRYERWMVHAVLVFAVVMTGMVLYTFFSGSDTVVFLSSGSVRSWYGFLIGSAFAGVVGTGFYPLMGNRVWCRFGCPLSAYMGLVQRFKSRFRITVNGGQCISCGHCSTYCEMGIDVRAYAQRGQDVVRASCVGCGICVAVCPRGVLKLENASADVSERAREVRVLKIEGGMVKLEEE